MKRDGNAFIALAKKLNPTLNSLAEKPILNANKEEVGWHCYAYSKDGFSYSGGTHREREMARRIAIAECLERATYHTIAQSQDKQDGEDLRKELLMDTYPSTIGFAVGFKREGAKLRALGEGLERWAWSKWIDDGYLLPQVEAFPSSFSDLAKVLLSVFEDIAFYQKRFLLKTNEHAMIPLNFNLLLGFKGKGVFPGSRVTTPYEDQWEHATIEAWRTWNNFHLIKKKKLTYDKKSWLTKRIMYFGEHREEAKKIIASCQNRHWPSPEIQLLKEVPLSKELFKEDGKKSFFVWRCLMKNFLSWHKGGENRFVY